MSWIRRGETKKSSCGSAGLDWAGLGRALGGCCCSRVGLALLCVAVGGVHEEGGAKSKGGVVGLLLLLLQDRSERGRSRWVVLKRVLLSPAFLWTRVLKLAATSSCEAQNVADLNIQITES
ncbi:hypothetical protein R1flu_002569 [Riccia fluitans]|uniref:Uncharacterized protein n=1 Tax=Riccia fluitans TaxID=41844 RepID=A0ABD1Y6H8_9MARC